MNPLLRRASLFCAIALTTAVTHAQSLSPMWEDLTSADFVKAIGKSGGVCMLPFGSIEKFGPAGPLGTNVYLARIVAQEAAKQEYAVIFPDYFAAVTTSSSSLPGTINYSARLQVDLLDETLNEMARNGCKKILIVNGHTPNMAFLSTFLDNFHQKPHNFVVYYVYGTAFPVFAAQYAKLPKDMQPSKPGVDGHGGEERMAALLAFYPELIHLDRAHDEPIDIGHGGANEQNAKPRHLAQGFTDSLPTGYSGDPSGATVTRGKALIKYVTDQLVATLREIKADNKTLQVQQQFYEKREDPLR